MAKRIVSVIVVMIFLACMIWIAYEYDLNANRINSYACIPKDTGQILKEASS